MGIALGILLAVVALGYIAWPFVRSRSAIRSDDARTRGELQRSRAEIYRLIHQLEADNAAGLMGDDDLRAQIDEMKAEAARLMKEEAALGSIPDPAAELEREIAAARAGLGRRKSAQATAPTSSGTGRKDT